jgi:hypothetical protein
MKLPSLTELIQRSSGALSRFPFVLLSAACSTAAAVIAVDPRVSPAATWLHSVALASVLGIPLFFALALVHERWSSGRGAVAGTHGAAILLLLLVAASLPPHVFTGPEMHLMRLWMLAAGLHFLVAIAPFVAPGEYRGFWQYNRILLQRMLVAGLFSGVLYSGLAIALLSIEKLFGFSIAGERYMQLWLLIAGLFNTWFFLAGIPVRLESLDADERYPRGLKVFSQHVLLPLVVVYLAILYAYGIKILLEWDWPRGWVANLVLGFSTAGMFALLLLWPLREDAGKKWIRLFTRYYFFALVPLVVMMMLGVWRRIQEYGITEGRYIVVALGFWLVAMIVVFLWGKKGAIKAVPASLALLACCTAFGPWGAFAVSEQDQMGRLRGILTRTGILVEGSIRPAARPPEFAEAKEISSVLRYLVRVHGAAELESWLGQLPVSAEDTLAGGGRGDVARRFAARLGVRYVEEWQAGEGQDFSFFNRSGGPVAVTGFSFLVRGIDLHASGPAHTFSAGGMNYAVRLAGDSALVEIQRQTADSAVLRLDLAGMMREQQDHPTPAQGAGERIALVATGTGPGMKATLLIESIQGKRTGPGYALQHVRADLLLSDSTAGHVPPY